MKRQTSLALGLLFCAGLAQAGDDTLKAAIGGGAGGAIGAAIGEELGDRNGAIVGGAVGGAVGAAIATDGRDDTPTRAVGETVRIETGVPAQRHPAVHCPPGQAKKGRC